MSIFSEIYALLGLLTTISIGLLAFGLILDEMEDGYGVATTLFLVVFIFTDFYFGELHNNIDMSFRGIAIYLGCGFVYVVIRVFFLGFSTKEQGKDIDDDHKLYLIKNHIWRWWLNWVISLLGWIYGDVARKIVDLLWGLLKSIMLGVFNLGNKIRK